MTGHNLVENLAQKEAVPREIELAIKTEAGKMRPFQQLRAKTKEWRKQ